jgi:hypothetical protein
VSISGVLGFDGLATVTHHGEPGIVTATAQPGDVIIRGGVIYAVANRPVRLLYGPLPAYRELAEGVSAGPDVLQLERNLAALGMRPGRVDQQFTAATTAAIRRWQVGSRDQRTGRLALGSVVFAPAPLRIGQIQVPVGSTVQPDQPVLTATSTDRVVSVQLPTNRQYQVHPGDRVRVTISGIATALPGMVTWIGRIATSNESEDTRTGATVSITVQVDLPGGTPDLDQAPAQVAITTRQKEGVLQVPVVALLPRPGGGYQVRLSTGEFVPVEPGLFDATAATVEVTGALTVSQEVQVPAP